MNAKLSPDDMTVSFRVMGCLVLVTLSSPFCFLFYSYIITQWYHFVKRISKILFYRRFRYVLQI